MKHPIVNFLPSKKLFITLGAINLLAFLLIGGSLYYYTNLSNLTTDNTNVVHPFNFIEKDGKIYWLAVDSNQIETSSDSSLYRVEEYQYMLKVKDQNKIYTFSILEYTNEINMSASNEQSYLELKLLTVVDEFIIILITDNVGVTIRSNNSQVYYRYQYLLLVSISQDIKNLEKVTLINVTNSEYTINDIQPYENNLLLLLRPVYYGLIFDYILDPTKQDVFVISNSFRQELIAIHNSYSSTQTFQFGNRKQGNPLPFTAHAYNFLQTLKDEFGEDRGLITIEYIKRTNIALIDSKGIIHFTGKFYTDNSTYFQSFRVEGGNINASLYFNIPDYLAYNPKTRQKQYWDILPFVEDRDKNIIIREIDSQIVMSFIGPPMDNVYNNPKLNPLSEYDRDYTFQWSLSRILQVFTIDPFNWDTQNLLQFDPQLSQTSDSNVTFPRPSYYLSVVDYGYNDYSLFVDNTSLYIATTLFETEEGLSRNLISLPDNHTFESSYGKSIILFKFDFNDNRLHYRSYEKITGPDQVLKTGYTENEWNNIKISGISVENVLGSVLISNGQVSIIYSARFTKAGVDKFWKLVFEDVTLEEVF